MLDTVPIGTQSQTGAVCKLPAPTEFAVAPETIIGSSLLWACVGSLMVAIVFLSLRPTFILKRNDDAVSSRRVAIWVVAAFVIILLSSRLKDIASVIVRPVSSPILRFAGKFIKIP